MLWTGCADPVSPNPIWGRLAAVIDPTPNPVQIYGSWHCSNDYCTWGAERNLTEFDAMNRWLVNRGDGRPSVNLVVLSFVHPYRLLKKTSDAQTVNGIPRGMTPAVVNYFKSRGIRVMLSIGGITYVSPGIRRWPRMQRSSGSTPPKSLQPSGSGSRSTMKRTGTRTW